ncbi:hypothetical protein JKP88DRAFT_246283 [Tribonema minus]|uniref:Uncharacterized protein n=1 Tax=Tribonema minus TaxID=303371 RepID=A0A835Z202_9STRA|nr:hypothetical protein JKP88DRAFT_246283 [Tribonema minus]
MIAKAVLLGTAACLLGAAWYAPRRARRCRRKHKQEGQLTKASTRETAWALTAADAEWVQLVFQRFVIHQEMADSIMRELRSLRCDDNGDYDGESCAKAPISLPLGELDAIWEATEAHLRTVDEWPSEYQTTLECFRGVDVLPWDDSACNGRRQLLQGLFDALDAEIEVLEGCMSEVRALAADAPNRESTVIELVQLVHHLARQAHDLSGCLFRFLEQGLQQSTVEITSRCKRLRRLGGGLQRVPMSREEHAAMARKQRAQWAHLRECSSFIVEHLPLLHRQCRTPAWVYWYPEWSPQPNPVALWLNAGLRARIEQRRLQQDIDSAPDVIAKFRLRRRRVARRRIDLVAPLAAAARACVGTPAAAADAAAGPTLPDGERVARSALMQQTHRAAAAAAAGAAAAGVAAHGSSSAGTMRCSLGSGRARAAARQQARQHCGSSSSSTHKGRATATVPDCGTSRATCTAIAAAAFAAAADSCIPHSLRRGPKAKHPDDAELRGTAGWDGAANAAAVAAAAAGQWGFGGSGVGGGGGGQLQRSAATLPRHPAIHSGQLLGAKERKYLEVYLLAYMGLGECVWVQQPLQLRRRALAGMVHESELQRTAMRLLAHGRDGLSIAIAADAAANDDDASAQRRRVAVAAANECVLLATIAKGSVLCRPAEAAEAQRYIDCARAAAARCHAAAAGEPLLDVLRAHISLAWAHVLVEDYAGRKRTVNEDMSKTREWIECVALLDVLRTHTALAWAHVLVEDYAGFFAYYHCAADLAAAILRAHAAAKAAAQGARPAAGTPCLDEEAWIWVEALGVVKNYVISFLDSDAQWKAFVQRRLLQHFSRAFAMYADLQNARRVSSSRLADISDAGSGMRGYHHCAPGMILMCFAPRLPGLPEPAASRDDRAGGIAAMKAAETQLPRHAMVTSALTVLAQPQLQCVSELVATASKGCTRLHPLLLGVDMKVAQLMMMIHALPRGADLAAPREAGARLQHIVERLVKVMDGTAFLAQPSIMHKCMAYELIFLRLLAGDEPSIVHKCMAYELIFLRLLAGDEVTHLNLAVKVEVVGGGGGRGWLWCAPVLRLRLTRQASIVHNRMAYELIFLRLLAGDEEGSLHMLRHLSRMLTHAPGVQRSATMRHNVSSMAQQLLL